MRVEWDIEKDRLNQKKHKISFSEARGVFEDPLHLSILDHRFSYFEERWLTIGQSKEHHLLVFANLFFNAEGEEIIRIISAREASLNERKQYEKF